jgi:TolB-like protein/lipoprotein NlpI
MMSFFAELKRRNVVRVGIAYVVAAWLLMQVADIVFDTIGSPPWVMQTLLAALAIGFPLALFFAWAFELTPEGVKREKDVDRSQSITPQTGKKLNNTILVLMAVAIAYLLFDKFSEKGSEPFSQTSSNQSAHDEEKRALTPVEAEPEISKQSIAVLPFDNRSNREEDQFFTDGIHDDLLTTIARIGSMKVISRTSVMEYKNTTKKLPEIAKELGVANILEGGIQRAGNQVRINVQLIDANTDEHLWAEIFDRELTTSNLFAIQSEISKAIADALQATLSPEEVKRIDAKPTDSLVAYDAYLRGRQLMATRKVAKLELAVEEFNKAVELDPQFALAWVGVADSNALLSNYGTLSDEIAIPIRQDAINRALAIDDGLGEAYASLGLLQVKKNEYEEAEISYKQAIALNPNYAIAYLWYANLTNRFVTRRDERIELTQKAAELDPRSEIIAVNLGGAYGGRGLYSMEEAQYLKLIELNPDSPMAHSFLAGLYFYEMSRYEAALSHMLKAVELDPGRLLYLDSLVDLYLELDDLAAAEAVRERMSTLDANHATVGFTDLKINRHKNNNAGARESINWLLPKITDDPGSTIWAGSNELAMGNTDRARDIYLSAVPGGLEPEQWNDLLNLYAASGCIASWILINTGDVELGQQLLHRTTIFLDETLAKYNEHADWSGRDMCYLTAGDTEKALQTIETYLSHNHLRNWKGYHQLPMFDLIRHEPRYQAALAERNRRVAEQREAMKEAGLL